MGFDASHRIVGLCGGAQGFTMRLIDPTTLAQIASLDMPARDLTSGANPLSDLCGGTYFYLDRHHHAYVLTTGNQLWEVTIGGTSLTHTKTYAPTIPDGDCMIATMPDWKGRIFFATKGGRVGTIDPATGASNPDLPGRGDLQLDGHRRDRCRLHRHRPPAARARGGQERDAAGAVGGAVRPGHAAEARAALAGIGYDAHPDRQGPRRDHRQRRAADERAVLQARRQPEEPADLQGTGVRLPAPRTPRTAWSRPAAR